MNRYWGRSFYNFIEPFFYTKIIYAAALKSFFFPLRSDILGILLAEYYILWLNIFKYKKPLKRRQQKQFGPFISYNYKTFITNRNFSTYSNLLKNNFLIYFIFNKTSSVVSELLLNFLRINFNFTFIRVKVLKYYKHAIGEGFFYIRGLLIILFIDACITDDEPLWEPIEWSLVQTWVFFIFVFAWIAENLITSRYGSYTGRDKRVWFAWYKSFWLIEFWYFLSYGSATVFVIVPFYWELTYNISLVFSWWNWYSRIFFFKFISLYSLVLFLAFIFQINIRWLNWKKLIFFIITINFFIAYLFYTHFIMSLFGYFTDVLWYQRTRFIDYIQLSHEPLKWGWGPAKRDHFTYHRVSTVFWFKNDGPFAGSFLMMHLFFLISIFMVNIYWLTLLRRVYATKEITYTFATFCVSALKQFYFFFLLLYGFVFLSFLINYWRFPIEFLWIINANSWMLHLLIILKDYIFFLLNIFF